MNITSGTPDLFVQRLLSIASLGDDDVSAILSLPFSMADVGEDQDLVREGQRPTRSCVIFEGFSCWSKVTAEGHRQILNFHVPGDMPDLQSIHIPVMDSTLSTITRCRIGFIDHDTLRRLCASRPTLAAALWKMTLIEAGNFREWIVNIGGRPAYNRIAHLFCEMMTKLKAVGLSDGHSCPFPIKQSAIAEATGLSMVHLNRNLQKMRASGLIELKDGILRVGDWNALAEVGEFDPTYLHLLTR